MNIRKRKAQSTLEYSILIIVVLGAFIATSVYVKRGVQGRWKTAADDVGDQYDPRFQNVATNSFLVSNSLTQIRTVNANGGFWTIRTDDSNSTESKSGSEKVGPYTSP